MLFELNEAAREHVEKSSCLGLNFQKLSKKVSDHILCEIADSNA